jgi:hypothetical protein
VPNVKTIAALGELDRGEHKSVDTVKEMMADLDAGDWAFCILSPGLEARACWLSREALGPCSVKA